jgi:hypothetical protein
VTVEGAECELKASTAFRFTISSWSLVAVMSAGTAGCAAAPIFHSASAVCDRIG